MCGGATVFNALQFYGVKSTDRVGITGLGGLGHLVIQFAAAVGCEVVMFSETNNKKEEAMKLGAREFCPTNGVQGFKIKPIDQLLFCTSAQPDWAICLPVMAPSGTIYPLTIDHGDFKMPCMPIMQTGLTIQGSIVPARRVR